MSRSAAWFSLALLLGCAGASTQRTAGAPAADASADPPAAAPLNDGGRGPSTSGAEPDAGRPVGSIDAALTDGAATPASDAAIGATDGAEPLEPRTPPRTLAAPPTYLGSVDNSAACDREYATTGFEPVDATPSGHPLFLYFVGTRFVATDPSAEHDNPAALAVTEAMARRGYVALSVEYDNGPVAWLSDHAAQLSCLFDAARPRSLLAVACALPRVDCELGIATWGHSQGGYVAVKAKNVDARVGAAWATGYGGDADSVLPRQRLRVVNGEADSTNGTAAMLDTIAGFTPGQCADDADRCLRADGSGWIIVRRSALADPAASSADHCWFDRRSCLDAQLALEPRWVEPDSDAPFALETNADWLAGAARLP